MSKLHKTSGTKTCNRLKPILLFPCDKRNTEYIKSLHQYSKQDAAKYSLQQPSAWSKASVRNQDPTQCCFVFPPQLHSDPVLDFPCVARRALPYQHHQDEAGSTESTPSRREQFTTNLQHKFRVELNRNSNVFSTVSSSETTRLCPQSSIGFIRQYRTCQQAAERQRRQRQGLWHWFWGTPQASAALQGV